MLMPAVRTALTYRRYIGHELRALLARRHTLGSRRPSPLDILLTAGGTRIGNQSKLVIVDDFTPVCLTQARRTL